MLARSSSKDETIPAHPSPLRLVVGTIFHTLLLPGSLVVVLPGWLLGSAASGATKVPPVQLGIGVLLAVVGIGILAVCFWDFIVCGKGTPNPLDPPRVLVHERLYRYIRNPIYVAVVMILIGEALVFAAPVLVFYAAGVWLFLQTCVVLYEEPTLRRDFGARYDAYCGEVPRWIPRLPLG